MERLLVGDPTKLVTVLPSLEVGHGNRPQSPVVEHDQNQSPPLKTVILVCLVLLVSYFAPKLAGALLLHPKTAWPLWPGCAVLVSVLLFVPRRNLASGYRRCLCWVLFLYDLQAGVPIWFDCLVYSGR